MTREKEIKVALITGAGSGIGRATCLEFAAHGYAVVMVGRREARLRETEALIAKAHPEIKTLALATDVSQEAEVRLLFERVVREFGGVDCLVNNAAVFKKAEVVDQSLADWNEVVAINLTGPFLCAREFLLQKKKTGRGSSIINISSLAGLRGTDKIAGSSSYCATKYAVVGLTEVLAVEGGPLGIRVNCLAPGAIDTEMLRTAFPSFKAKAKPHDLAKIILFLADEDKARIVQGSTFEVFCNP